MAQDPPLQVLVVDDSVLFRKLISEAVNALPGARAAATAPSGAIALQKLQQQPVDVVLLDIFMPVMDGLETLRRIRDRFPHIEVVMLSGIASHSAATTLKALEMGAVDFCPKPECPTPDAGRAHLADSLRPIFRLLEIRRIGARHRSGSFHLRQDYGGQDGGQERIPPIRPPPDSPTRAAAPSPSGGPAAAVKPPHLPAIALGATAGPSRFNLVVIAVSTGGPNALNAIIPKLPKNMRVPILLVQHMPAVFTASLAEHLAKASMLAVREAVDNEPVLPGVVLIAPGGRHMSVKRSPLSALRSPLSALHIALNDDPPVNSCRPSADVLFRSVSEAGETRVLAVVLTGMGEDGAAGVAQLKQTGCHCLVQNEASCVVYGMPRAVVARALADEILPLDAMADRLIELTRYPPVDS
ncbi:MAG: chemotaxis-specific protein-glutamate methyltransferase CheB [Lentisphaerae bacterium]|nr:chemotaxis-specific protein-glutamate methyltransferase CheB [Lentisphaerota bacterium]